MSVAPDRRGRCELLAATLGAAGAGHTEWKRVPGSGRPATASVAGRASRTLLEACAGPPWLLQLLPAVRVDAGTDDCRDGVIQG